MAPAGGSGAFQAVDPRSAFSDWIGFCLVVGALPTAAVLDGRSAPERVKFATSSAAASTERAMMMASQLPTGDEPMPERRSRPLLQVRRTLHALVSCSSERRTLSPCQSRRVAAAVHC